MTGALRLIRNEIAPSGVGFDSYAFRHFFRRVVYEARATLGRQESSEILGDGINFVS